MIRTRNRHVTACLLLALSAPLWSGCGEAGGGSGSSASADPAATDTTQAATPVEMAEVVRRSMVVEVRGAGSTQALHAERIRAPFAGVLQSLDVAVGDRVEAGERIGTIVARSSHAALQGARSMVASATTPQERSDAERALAVARRNLVESALTVRHGGVVVSRTASPGELLAEGDSIASIAATDQMSFIARVPQGDAGKVQAGQPARVFLTGRTAPVLGTAHAVLPADAEAAMTLPVRIDLRGDGGPPVTVGLFGTARIEVERHEDAAVVPRGAIVRDDITGTTRMAVVQEGRAHWVDVVTGVADSLRLEIVHPHLDAGLRVIVSGQVGLPDGAPVAQDTSFTAPGPGGGS